METEQSGYGGYSATSAQARFSFVCCKDAHVFQSLHIEADLLPVVTTYGDSAENGGEHASCISV